MNIAAVVSGPSVVPAYPLPVLSVMLGIGGGCVASVVTAGVSQVTSLVSSFHQYDSSEPSGSETACHGICVTTVSWATPIHVRWGCEILRRG